jgi:hypothetical protein
MKTSRIKLLMTFAPTGTYVRDHKTTPEVVNISKVSNMTKVKGSGNVAKGRRGTVRRAHVGYDEGPCTLLPDGRNSEVPTTDTAAQGRNSTNIDDDVSNRASCNSGFPIL